MNKNIEPPTEYPRIFNIEFEITDGYPISEDSHWRYVDFKNQIEYEIKNSSFKVFLNKISNLYKDFMDLSSYQERRNFISYDSLLFQINNIGDIGKDGDIIEIFRYLFYYISGYENNRYITIIPPSTTGLMLPIKAISGIKYYDIHELKDVQKLYPNLNITDIQIPEQYYPRELSDLSEKSINFVFRNKEDLKDKNRLVILLDIGDYEVYNIVVSPVNIYVDYFKRKPELKV